ncbi:MAG: 4Fe-4S binding protein [Dehalococcoidia bacterium]|nr:4Fe-4S binding protein [Dehalococcoidia bacterium]MBL7166158.1 4Fe-4S binding protein [Dehalococcoidales bacterium]
MSNRTFHAAQARLLWRLHPFQEERCIGCSVCAFNCPDDALTMVKVRDINRDFPFQLAMTYTDPHRSCHR